MLRERYLAREQGEVVETPEEMCWRVARAIAEAEGRFGRTPAAQREIATAFYEMMVDGYFLPNSPTLMNAGKGNQLQYSACYVLPVGDSMEEIFESIKAAAIIQQSGGGTGFAFSRLRPKNDIVRSTGGRASGPVSFLRVFNAATEAVRQGGARRGANMGVLRVDHPDILEFIECKLDGGVTNFNISVGVTDAFMDALAAGADYDLVNPRDGQVTGRLAARDVFQRIVRAAWRTGDPGLVFLDRINASRANPTPELTTIEATNPCGEQSLPPWDACNLGSVNVARFVREAPDGGRPDIDWDELERVVRLAVRFLDDVIEVNPYPLPQIAATVKANRRIGLGIMGWADLLFLLEHPLRQRGSARAGRAAHGVHPGEGPRPVGAPGRGARALPELPAVDLSRRPPAAELQRHHHRAHRDHLDDRRLLVGDRAPLRARLRASRATGPRASACCRSSARPSSAWRARAASTPTRSWPRWCGAARCSDIPGVDESVRAVFKTAHEIDYRWHVLHQAAFQRHTDNGVSKTINLPHDATEDDVAQAYLLAWEKACLGITVFRDGSKGSPGAAHGCGAERGGRRRARRACRSSRGPTAWPAPPTGWRRPSAPPSSPSTTRPRGIRSRSSSRSARPGPDTMAVAEALGRLVSLILRLPSPLSPRRRVDEVMSQLSRIGGGQPTGFGAAKILSLPDALARTLGEHVGERAAGPASGAAAERRQIGDLCRECGQATFIYEEGCKKCVSCGFNEC